MIRQHRAAIIFYLVILLVMTFPLVFKMNSAIPGFFSSDEVYAPIWESWRIKFSAMNNLSFMETKLIAFPFGTNIYKDSPISYIWMVFYPALSFLLNPVLKHNILLLINFFLSAFFTYLLVFKLTGDKKSAFLSGTIFGFSPCLFMRSWQYFGETFVWTQPLFLLAIVMLHDKDSLRNRFIFCASYVLSAVNFSGIYYCSVILGIYLFYLSLKFVRNRKEILRLVLLVILSLGILSFQFYPIFKDVIKNRSKIALAQNIYHRPFDDLFLMSSRPLGYLLPAAVHPVWGRFTEQFVGSPFYGTSFTEHTLYLGWMGIVLAFIAYRKAKRKNTIIPGGDYDAREIYFVYFFVLLALAAWLFSQPPWWSIANLKIYLPAFFMYKVLPMFRAYARFGVVVMLAIAVLAGFGFKSISNSLNSTFRKIAVFLCLIVFVLFDFWNWPSYKIIDVSKIPAVYDWVVKQPGDFVLAEYPLDLGGPDELYKFYQTRHHKVLINGTVPGTSANAILAKLNDLSSFQTVSILKGIGVKYAIVHRDSYLATEQVEQIAQLERIPFNPGLKLISSFPSESCPDGILSCTQATGPIDLYEIIAEPEVNYMELLK